MKTLRLLHCPVNRMGHTRRALVLITLCALFAQMLSPFTSQAFAQKKNANFQLANSPVWFAENFTERLFSQFQQKNIAGSLGQMPLSFFPNEGQANPQIKFAARAAGFNLLLKSSEVVLALQNKAGDTVDAVRTKFVGANQNPQISGVKQLATVSNFYTGKNPANYRTNVPHFAQVRYEQIYPGVDLVYYEQRGQVEYDFIVAPGMNPNVIKMNFGARELRLDEDGSLVIQTVAGDLRQHKPFIYQQSENTLQPIAGNFVITDKNEVGFALSAYDTSKPLIIDPMLAYSTYLGGCNGNDYGYAIAADANGNAYITGETSSSMFNDTNIMGYVGGKDIFVAKLKPNGKGIDYFTFIGGAQDDYGRGIKVDASGNTYITGVMGSSFVPPGGVTGYVTADPSAGNDEAFVARLNPTGGLQYFTYLGGNTLDQGTGIALDGTDVYVTGITCSKNFPTLNAYDNSHNGQVDAFITKLNGSLSALSYSTFLGSYHFDYSYGIAVNAGKAYIVGNTQGSTFPTTATAFDNKLTGTAPLDAFVARFSTTGGLEYSTFLGGNGREYGYAIAVRTNGDFAVTGRSHAAPDTSWSASVPYNPMSLGFPITTNAAQTTQNGFGDVFVTRFNNAGKITYSTFLGGSEYDTGYAIAFGGTGNIFVAGETESPNLNTVAAIQPNLPGTDGFVARINPAGAGAADITYLTYFGGGTSDPYDGNMDSIRGIDVNGANAFIVGYTNSESTSAGGSFLTSPAAPYQGNLAGGFDAFVAKIIP